MLSHEAIDAFVCYNRDDAKDVSFICNQLRIRGNLKIFIDSEIKFGEKILDTIATKLHYAETFLFFIRKHPTPWQLEELQVAIRKQVETTRPFIIPVLLPNMEPEAFFENPKLAFISRSQAAQFLLSVEELDTLDGLKRAIEGNSRVYISARAVPRPDHLPAGYQADVGKITDILIGESLYASNNICIRELIQNARDACSRRRQSVSNMGNPPQISIFIDRNNRFFDIIDEGDGMTKHNLKESFSVLGASMNEQFHKVYQRLDSPITGKFGVGFISTFMIAERISVSTITPEDGAIHFEINSTRLPFKYTNLTSCDRAPSIGTTIRVYLKSEFIKKGPNKMDIKKISEYYCRHVPDLYIYNDSIKSRLESDWNFSDKADVFYIETKDEYEIRLSWASAGYDSIRLTNGGFYVCDLDNDILGEFPKGLVSGEINISPGLIDLNLTRDGVVSNEKVATIRDIIGSALSKFLERAHDEIQSIRRSSFAGDSSAKLQRLARSLMRACLIITKVFANKHIGKIPVKFIRIVPDYYHEALITDMAVLAAGSNSHKLHEIREKIEKGVIRPICAPKGRKLNEKYPENTIIENYFNYSPMSSVTVQLSDRQITTDAGGFGRLKPITGSSLVNEYEGEHKDEEHDRYGASRYGNMKYFVLKFWKSAKIFIYVWFSYKMTSYIPGVHSLILSYLPDWSIFRWLFAPSS